MIEMWAATKVGGATAGTMFALGNMIEDSHVSVTVAITCCVFISTVVWWLASRFQKIDDRLVKIENSMNNFETHQNKRERESKKRKEEE